MWLIAAANRDGTAEIAAPNGLNVLAHNTDLVEGSTSSLWAAKKSMPKMGLDTAAKMKEHKKEFKPKANLFVTRPQEAMVLPSAPTSGGPDGAAAER